MAQRSFRYNDEYAEEFEQFMAPVRPGDVVTAATPGKVRVLRVVASGERRGPATEAQALFEDLTDPPDPAAAGVDPDPGAAADE